MTDSDDQRSPAFRIGPRTLAIVYQDLSTVEADVIVSSDDNQLSMSGGVSARLAAAGGPCIKEHARKFVTPPARRPIRGGEVVVTTAGTLPARYVFHAVTIAGTRPDEQVIEEATARSMQLADLLGMTSIAFPALGTGLGAFPFQATAKVMIRTITVALDESKTVERATIALFAGAGVDQDELNSFYEDAVGQVALWQQTRRLAESLDRVVAEPALPQTVSDALQAVLGDVRDAQERLDLSTSPTAGPGQPEDPASLVELGRRVASALSDVQQSSQYGSNEHEAAARAGLERLRYEQTAAHVYLSQLQTDRRLGTSGPESDQQIAEATRELKDVTSQLAAAEERWRTQS